MAQVRIVTDSTADIPASVREQYGIEIVPLKVHFGSETFLDAITIQSEQFFDKLSAVQELPTTSQPSPVDFVEVYKKLAADGAEIISIHLSSAFSGTYQSAVLAKSLLEDNVSVTIIDSKSASYGLGMLAVEAAKAAQAGKSKDEIIELIQDVRNGTGLYFLVDTLEYLKKGGRIGKASALVGSLLNIKPILSIDEDGEISPVDKVRGSKRAISRIVELLKEDFEDESVEITIAHSSAEQAAQDFAALLKEHFDVKQTGFTALGPVIGTHVGPGTLAVFMRVV